MDWNGTTYNRQMRLGNVGALTLYNDGTAPTGGECGAGCLNAFGVRVNNVPVATTTGSQTLSATTLTNPQITGTVTGGATYSSPTLTSPVISTISNTGSITLPTSSVTLQGVLDRQNARQTVVNTSAETGVYSFSVPGGTLGTNRVLRVTILGDYFNNTGSGRTFTFRFKYGATTIATLAPFQSPTANRGFFRAQAGAGERRTPLTHNTQWRRCSSPAAP
jgi:hypothetical protein